MHCDIFPIVMLLGSSPSNSLGFHPGTTWWDLRKSMRLVLTLKSSKRKTNRMALGQKCPQVFADATEEREKTCAW